MGLCLALAASASFAQAYPTRTVTLVAPVAAGGLTDVLARVIAADLSRRFNASVIVENKVGAGGTVGMATVAKAEPDGYSLILVFQGPATVAPALYPALGYDTFRDFVPIGMVGSFQNAVVVGKDVPVMTVRELIELAKKQPGGINYGSAGNGSTSHLVGELFAREAGIRMTHVPYRGEAPALTDLAAGQTQVVFSTLAAAKPLADAGKIRIIAISTKTRSRFAPDLPTVSETGLPGFEVPGWYGILAPARTPPAIVATLTRALHDALNDSAFKAKLVEIGIEPAQMTVPEFADWLRKDTKKWDAVIKEAGIRAQ